MPSGTVQVSRLVTSLVSSVLQQGKSQISTNPFSQHWLVRSSLVKTKQANFEKVCSRSVTVRLQISILKLAAGACEEIGSLSVECSAWVCVKINFRSCSTALQYEEVGCSILRSCCHVIIHHMPALGEKPNKGICSSSSRHHKNPGLPHQTRAACAELSFETYAELKERVQQLKSTQSQSKQLQQGLQKVTLSNIVLLEFKRVRNFNLRFHGAARGPCS